MCKSAVKIHQDFISGFSIDACVIFTELEKQVCFQNNNITASCQEREKALELGVRYFQPERDRLLHKSL